MYVSFKRVRAEVMELWSGEPIADSELVQSVVESLTSLSFRYPSVRSVDPAQGLWDIHLPGDVVREYDRRDAIVLEVEAVDRYFQVRFLNRGAEVSSF
jgi:hypothetical protein